MSDNLYLVQARKHYHSYDEYDEENFSHPAIGVKRLFETEAAARAYRQQIFPPPWSPFANQGALLEVRGVWKWKKAILRLLCFPENVSGADGGTIKRIPLDSLFELIRLIGLPPPEQNIPVRSGTFGTGDAAYQIGDVSFLHAWWNDQSSTMTTGQRAALWSLLDPSPYEIIMIPFEKD